MYVKKLSRKRYNSKKLRKSRSKSKSKRTTRRRRSSKRGGAESSDCKGAKTTAQSLIRSYNSNSGSDPIDKEQVKTKLQEVFNKCKFIFSSSKTLSQNINEILGNTTTTTDESNNEE